MSNKVRTRYAPSPTGRMHVGNLRTALYAYLITKHEGGDYILRIEDTDQERYVEGATEIIYRTLEKTGLTYDEGPDKDGGCGPYVQSDRVKAGVYMKYALELIEKGEAYYCFCDKERLEQLHADAKDGEVAMYDKHCLSLSKAEVEANLAAGKPFVIRQNIPNEGETTFHDEIYGDITVPNKELDDMVLIKSDGYPTYNFANVIDDHLMGITHVVRGNEYLSSSPKYTRLYAAFGWKEPVYVHCPLITDEEHKKLSKRSGHSSYEDLIDQGYVNEAVVNYVALLGWSPADGVEIMSLQELIEKFDYTRINKSPAVFDIPKLRWLNGEYIKAMDDEAYYERALPIIKDTVGDKLPGRAIADLVKSRIETFLDIPEMIDFFGAVPDYDNELYSHKKMKTDPEQSLAVLKELLPILTELTDYSHDGLSAAVSAYIEEKQVKNGQVLWPLRIAVSGKAMTPGGAYEIMEILGKEESLRRIEGAIIKLCN
ncbi:MAG: glutamate--tRNA ligase [Lachnospiraceae bacterium]|nr:glutamate--tRNA ligase [Candidatus Minthocola equi]